MRRCRRPALTLLALAVVLGACLHGGVEMSEADARAFTRRALLASGLDGVRVSEDARRCECRLPQSRRDEDVWVTTATTDEGTVELWVRATGDRAVFVRDQDHDGEALLSDREFAALSEFRANPAADRATEAREVPAVVAGAAAAAAAVASVVTAVRLRRRAG